VSLVSSDARLSTATPLVAVLFVESALQRARQGRVQGDLPDLIPEVFLDYVRRLNPEIGPVESLTPHDLAVEAACILATASLGIDWVPADFNRSDAIRVLATRGHPEVAERVLARLVANGVIESRRVAVTEVLRFALDPAAEELASIDTVRRCGADMDLWQAHLNDLVQVRGYPDRCEGYLQALGVCYRAYRQPLRLPDLNLPWENVP
jgi:hypothetical protein